MAEPEQAEPPTIWRTKLRSTVPGVDHRLQEQHCFESGLIGIGWHVEHLDSGAPLEDVLDAIRGNPADGWGKGSADIVRRIGKDAQVGDFVWTRDVYGRYRLCRITGPYRYDRSSAAVAADVLQTRPVEWAPTPVNELHTPGGVMRAFVGRASSFQRIHDVEARRMTLWLWETMHGREAPVLDLTPETILTHLLDPYDVEDLVSVWMQAELGYLVFPKSRMKGTPVYEWTSVHRDTGRTAIMQVKTGDVAVDLATLSAAAPDRDTEVFAYATSGEYYGKPSSDVREVQNDELVAFARSHPHALPPRVRAWFEMANR